MKRGNYHSWNVSFMAQAIVTSMRSKDPKTQNGCVVVNNSTKVILASGYNGLSRGMDDSHPDYWADDDTNPVRSKHSYVVHAECNAILNRATHSLADSTLYVTQFPCPACAKLIAQERISRVIYLDMKTGHRMQNEISGTILKAAKCEFVPFVMIANHTEMSQVQMFLDLRVNL